MEKVMCKNCGGIGYTASPERLTCQCGGRFKVILEEKNTDRIEPDEETKRFISQCLNGIDYAGYTKID